MSTHQSWGRFPKAQQSAYRILTRFEKLPDVSGKILPYGLGRSYGDSCLNDGQNLVVTSKLDRFISFDVVSGILRCEAGVSFASILDLIVPRGWFLPVTPGTKYVTVGGAISNDIHGKNHHWDGNFGHHVLALEILRSDGGNLYCSPSENQDFFYASIGGLGLTGLILTAEIQLKKIASACIDQEIIKYRGLSEFFQIARESEASHMYTVSWIDCLGKGENFGRGLFIRGNHAKSGDLKAAPVGNFKSVPFDFPTLALNPLSIRIFNSAYYHKQLSKTVENRVHFDPFFYPLDGVHHWNRIYGKRGFLQWQCVVPFDSGPERISEILQRIVASGMASFLAVLKTFGKISPVGMMSFPREGVTLALDFPHKGEKLFTLLEALDKVVSDGGGAIYAAKDARMSAALFKQSYPAYKEFEAFVDPKFSSSFWRRIMELEK